MERLRVQGIIDILSVRLVRALRLRMWRLREERLIRVVLVFLRELLVRGFKRLGGRKWRRERKEGQSGGVRWKGLLDGCGGGLNSGVFLYIGSLLR